MMNSGIYRIRNLINGKFYIGRSYRLDHRWRVHFNALSKGTHYNHKLQRAVNKYGIDQFVFEVVEYAGKESLPDLEQMYIDDLNACSMYNISKSAYNGSCKDDPVFMNKVTEASRKYWSVESNRIKQSIALTGKSKSESHVKRVSESLTGKPKTETHISAVVNSQNLTRLSGNHKRSYPVIVDGVLYQSIRDASIKLQDKKLRSKVESAEYPTYMYMVKENGTLE